MPDSTLSTLDNIRIKVRRLTRSPSTSQLSDSDIDNYVNNFVLYDFPEHLRLFDLRETLTFYTQPNVAVYSTNTTVPTDPLYNFNNQYISVHPPVYIAGYDCMFSQSREQFFGIYPKVNFIGQIASGDGATTTFSVTLPNIPVLQHEVLINSIDANNNGLALVDVPTSNATGNLVVPNTTTVSGTINYITGVCTFTFLTPPAQGATINAQTVPYVPSLPKALLYFDDNFMLGPVPDQTYRVQVEVYVRPTELLSSSQEPNICQWWQYIAYGAAKKVFEDRSDVDGVNIIMPEFKQQELLVLRKTIVQITNQRTSTIYTEQAGTGTGGNGFGWGGGPF